MSNEETTDKDQKLVVDTDWKEQVAKEREQAEAEKAEAEAVPAAAGQQIDADSSDTSESPDDLSQVDQAPAADSSELPPPPAASFEVLVSMLFTQGIAVLGQLPNPATGKPEINKPYAKHYIDTLEMLGEKTTGNLSDDESKMLSEALHALRMAFVSVKA